jgi:hypothetical protein
MRARVFISCGQNQATEEVAVAQQISDSLCAMSYKPYVATQQRSLRGLTDNIFNELADSEYLLFVDFKREPLAGSQYCRGSLFSHQELAIAAFLRLDVLAFQETGVRRLDGMIQYLQANAFPFTDRSTLPSLVAAKVNDLWRPDWRKTLRLERDPTQHTDADSNIGRRRFFHAAVVNQHRHRVAAHAYVYLDSLLRESDGFQVPVKTVELKWAGYTFPNAVIRPGTSRDFDCCWVHHDRPSRAFLSSFSDATDYSPVMEGPGRFLLRFTALAEGFEPQSLAVVLTLGTTLAEAGVVPK